MATTNVNTNFTVAGVTWSSICFMIAERFSDWKRAAARNRFSSAFRHLSGGLTISSRSRDRAKRRLWNFINRGIGHNVLPLLWLAYRRRQPVLCEMREAAWCAGKSANRQDRPDAAPEDALSIFRSSFRFFRNVDNLVQTNACRLLAFE